MVVARQRPDYYGDLFTLQNFDEAVSRSPSYVKIANAAANKTVALTVQTAKDLEAILEDARAGGTLVLDKMHEREPKLGLLCRVLAAELGHLFQTNLYLTPPQGRGFGPHWDDHDVFILQVLGCKHWKIEKQRRAFPSRDENMGPEGRELLGEIDSFVLEQGDLVYIPRGFVHAAESGAELSLHITLGVRARFWEDLLHAVVKAAGLRDERIRHALPLGYNKAQRDGLIFRLANTVRGLNDESFLAGVVDQYLDDLVTLHPLDVSNQVAFFFSPKDKLCLASAVGARRAIAYQSHVADETVRVNYGARTIVFPSIFREALEFALQRPIFVVRDIPGDLEDEERIAFAERLLEEGLLVRNPENASP